MGPAGSVLLRCAGVDLGVQWALGLVAIVLRTEVFFDAAGSGTFLLLTYLSRKWSSTKFLRQQIQSGLVSVWGLRLGMYLFLRILREGKDSRFDKVRDKPSIFFMFWTLQAVWVFVTLLPTLIVNTKKQDSPLTLRDYLGWAVWVLGFTVEMLADHQKSFFRSDPNNVGKFIQSGLWAYSRHPNYVGEILQWLGLFVSASSVLSGWEWLSAASPLLVWLLLSHVSGVPILERQAMRRWGLDPAYRAYVKRTPVLFPFSPW
ncbi:uncharacterized protein LOC133344492 isoform X1 [Lethenteron reissneri]|uniref:uncharacterized protein LOC133344492 isoform X1 n=1 Tax=Lethenteron reissneri TaxID=7753 RepID=UPI002AB7CDCC|nr:uncharacterized protein LOC133344492 isoform X1 [Lethenteron reissneri]